MVRLFLLSVFLVCLVSASLGDGHGPVRRGGVHLPNGGRMTAREAATLGAIKQTPLAKPTPAAAATPVTPARPVQQKPVVVAAAPPPGPIVPDAAKLLAPAGSNLKSCPSACRHGGYCYDGACQCPLGYTGIACQTKKTCEVDSKTGLTCGGAQRGSCDATTQTCVCAPGFTGKNCESIDKLCAGTNCNNHGSCNKGVCFCDNGFAGKFCDREVSCLQDNKPTTTPCGGRGLCYENVCRCYPGFSGEFCEQTTPVTTCKNNCSGRGVCQFGQCLCPPQFTGEDCSSHEAGSFCAISGGDCSGHGVCANGKCRCEPGTSGTFCEKGGCKKCHPTQGVCLKDQCFCKPGFGGEDCATVLTCPNSCSNHGICLNGLCLCEKFYSGVSCEKADLTGCPNNCNGNGVCHLGKCMCIPGRTGPDCLTNVPLTCGSAPPKAIAATPTTSLTVAAADASASSGLECNGNGSCFRTLCVCKPGYFGKYCEKKKTCSQECQRNGICNYGTCLCAPDFTGKDCQISRRPQAELVNVSGKELDTFVASGTFTCKDGDAYKCSLHGVCSSNKCLCDEGFTGVTCEQVLLTGIYSARCPKGCSDHGFCQFGKCVCDIGFTGDSCSEAVTIPCEKNCNGKGICEFGRCHCDSDYAGATCETKLKCSVDCAQAQQGVCVAGRCVCLNGYTGVNCATPPENTSAATTSTKLALTTNKRKTPAQATAAGTAAVVPATAARFAQKDLDSLDSLVDSHIHAEMSAAASSSAYAVPVHPALLGVVAFILGVLVAFGITYAYNKREEQIRKKPLFATR